jgi:molecular chaperone GrpE
LEECKKLKDEYLNGWKRERADFLNYKKEEMERIRELMKYANEELILKMLPILDNFEVASKNISEKLKNDDNIKGFLQIRQQIKDFLKMQGVEEIKTIGEKFNPNFMEITEEIEIKDKEPGIVVEEIQKGYTSHGKVIRPAKVKVSK